MQASQDAVYLLARRVQVRLYLNSQFTHNFIFRPLQQCLEVGTALQVTITLTNWLFKNSKSNKEKSQRRRSKPKPKSSPVTESKLSEHQTIRCEGPHQTLSERYERVLYTLIISIVYATLHVQVLYQLFINPYGYRIK
ncbi:Hypothetical_protein [Hexamita inflata]|uniref:Hypothetical_protein n=1 Tax=Hexamita inflata TaxID=28002 RepID=A0ABP1M3G1_9EUKA